MRTNLYQVRLGQRHATKMAQIRELTGLTTSQVLRQLLENAEVKSAQITVNLPKNANSDGIRQDTSVAVRA